MKYFIAALFLLFFTGCQTSRVVHRSFVRNGVEIDLKYFEVVECVPIVFAASGLLSGSMLLSTSKDDLPDMKKFEKIKTLHKKVWEAFNITKKYKDKGLSHDELIRKTAIASDEALGQMSLHVPELVSYCREKAKAFKKECYEIPVNNNFSQCVNLGEEDLTNSVVGYAHSFYKIKQSKKKK